MKVNLLYFDVFWGPPSLLSNGYRGLFSGGKAGRGVMLTTHPHLVPRSRKRGAIPPLTPNAYMAYSGTNFTFSLVECVLFQIRIEFLNI